MKPDFSAFDRCRILVVGDLMLDEYVWGSVERISPEAPVPVLSVTSEEFTLGGAANVAKNIAVLGAQRGGRRSGGHGLPGPEAARGTGQDRCRDRRRGRRSRPADHAQDPHHGRAPADAAHRPGDGPGDLRPFGRRADRQGERAAAGNRRPSDLGLREGGRHPPGRGRAGGRRDRGRQDRDRRSEGHGLLQVFRFNPDHSQQKRSRPRLRHRDPR